MAELKPEIVDSVLAACKAGVAEAAEALSRALDGTITLEVGDSGTLNLEALPEELSVAGLAVVLTIGETGALMLIPESNGLVPGWCAAPDPTGESKLSTLAQELGMIVLPEDFMPDDFKAARVKNLAGALRRGDAGEGAAFVALNLTSGNKQTTAQLVWPISKPAAVLGKGTIKPEAKPQPKASPKPAAAKSPPPSPPQPSAALEEARRAVQSRSKLRQMPAYTKSLLRVKVPVVVTLAHKRQPLAHIVELGPGSIIQFDKACEEMLELEIGDRRVATGEAVKVGDKFGLRVMQIILPDERFHPVRAQ